MNFCKVCESVMIGYPTPAAEMMYRCPQCLSEEKGSPASTLIYSDKGGAGVGSDYGKYQDYIRQAPFDPVAKKVKKPCLSCGYPHLTLTQVGDELRSVYVCICGARVTHKEYEKKAREAPNN